jgi:hypothetical protein
MGDPFAGFLFGYHVIEPGLQAVPDRRDGVLGVEEREGVLELAAVGAQLIRRQCMDGVLRLADSRRWAGGDGG